MEFVPQNSVLNVIHEDADLLVVNKPAGLVCHPPRATNFPASSAAPACICSQLLNRLSVLNAVVCFMPHLVNRLDRETSGVVLIAKNAAAAGELGKIWETRAVEKEYLAIVHGHVRDDHGLIDAPLGKDESSRVAIKDCVRPDGAPAQTEFFVERRFSVLRVLARA